LKAKIVLLDIETAPNLSYTWGKWDQNVIAFEREWYMLTYAWKYLDDPHVTVKGLIDYPEYDDDPENDGPLIRDLWHVYDDADIVIAHNGDAFDIKKSNARFVVHNLPPPSGFKTVDTLKAAKKTFKFESNKLDDLGQHLELGQKLQHGGFGTWLGCMRKDPESWALMKEYNVQDVLLLEKVYTKLKPWMPNHPNLNLYTAEKDNCPTCSSSNVEKRGFAYAKTRAYQRWHCKGCGAWYQGKLIK
jgi:hypothetical protein